MALKFHQFVFIEKGAFNSAIINFLTGDIYQVPNQDLEKLEKGHYADIEELLNFGKAEGLLIEIDPQRWIPAISFEADKKKAEETGLKFIMTLEIEEGADLSLIAKRFDQNRVQKIFFYGHPLPDSILPTVPIIMKEKNPASCHILATVNSDFLKTNERDYLQNILYNTCWAGKIAITKDNLARPCMYSAITLGNLQDDTVDAIIKGAEQYWRLTKDKITTCKDCELKFICFDCRESALQKTDDLYAHNPGCSYNPYTGQW